MFQVFEEEFVLGREPPLTPPRRGRASHRFCLAIDPEAPHSLPGKGTRYCAAQTIFKGRFLISFFIATEKYWISRIGGACCRHTIIVGALREDGARHEGINFF